MKEKCLCDRCKREFTTDEDNLLTYDGRPIAEIICNDCKEDSVLSDF